MTDEEEARGQELTASRQHARDMALWEVKIVRYYDSKERSGLQHDEMWRLRGSEHEALEAAVNHLCREEGWEPYAYSDYGVAMWLRRRSDWQDPAA